MESYKLNVGNYEEKKTVACSIDYTRLLSMLYGKVNGKVYFKV